MVKKNLESHRSEDFRNEKAPLGAFDIIDERVGRYPDASAVHCNFVGASYTLNNRNMWHDATTPVESTMCHQISTWPSRAEGSE